MLRLLAPAKLNLMLRILGRRADGYHLLQSVIEPIDLGDRLRLRRRRDGRIVRRHGCSDVPFEQDLAVRAAQALQQACGTGLGVEFDLVKRVPMGAGLGGGSADAAAMLRGLNLLWRLHWPLHRLSALGASLGADVAAQLQPATVWAEGIGEQLSPFVWPRRHYVVVFPGVGAATPMMFAAPQLRRDCVPLTPEQFHAGHELTNVFEPVAAALIPAVGAARDWLRARLADARLTGSGSAIFATAPDRTTAVAVARACPHPWQAWACRSWRGTSTP